MDDETKTRSKKAVLTILFIFIVFFFAILLFWELFKWSIVVKTFNYVVQNINNVTGISPWLLKGLVIAALFPFFWALKAVIKPKLRLPVFSKNPSKDRRPAAAIILVSYVILYFISMYLFSRGSYFGHIKGEVLKYYARTPEGIRFFDSPGYDPKYGLELKPVDAMMIEQQERAKRGLGPRRIERQDYLEYFDSITGEPKIWYYLDVEGHYELFDQPGYHPVHWEKLKPMSKVAMEDRLKKIKEDEEKIEVMKRERAEREAFEKKKAWIDQSLNTGVVNNAETQDVAIAVVEGAESQYSESSRKLADAIAVSLQRKDGRIKGRGDLFKDAFIEGGGYLSLLEGDSSILFELNLNSHADFLALGKKTTEFSSESKLANLISCKCVLDLALLSVKTGEVLVRREFSAAGVGVDNIRAESQAHDRLAASVGSFLMTKIGH